MRENKYILDEQGEPVLHNEHWSRALDACLCSPARIVAITPVSENASVSTDFWGCFGISSPDKMWRTIVAGGPHGGRILYCGGSRADAIEMHNGVVTLLAGGAISQGIAEAVRYLSDMPRKRKRLLNI